MHRILCKLLCVDILHELAACLVNVTWGRRAKIIETYSQLIAKIVRVSMRCFQPIFFAVAVPRESAIVDFTYNSAK